MADEISKVAIYARQSSGDEEGSPSIEVQIEGLTKMAQERGFEVILTENDGNTSGRTYPDTLEARQLSAGDQVFQAHFHGKSEDAKLYRGGLARIIDILPEVDAVLVRDHTRLMRPLTDSFLQAYVHQKFTAAQTCLLSRTEGLLDFSIFRDVFVSGIDSMIQDNALKINADKTLDGIEKKRNGGELWNSSVVNSYGYRQTGKQKVEVVEAEAVVVQEVFQRFNDGETIMGIVKRLNACGVPTKTGKGKWRQDSVKHMLKRHVYAGFDYTSQGERIQVKPLEGKALIDEVTFAKAHSRLTENGKYRTYRTQTVHPLSGLLYCGYCGGPMHRQSRDDYMCHDNVVAMPKSAANCGCRMTRIKEIIRNRQQLSLPPQRMEPNGLYEALMPLCVKGLLEVLHTEQKDDSIALGISEIDARLVRIDAFERTLGSKLLDDKLLDSQFENAMKQAATERSVLMERKIGLQEKQASLEARIDKDQAIDALSHLLAGDIHPPLYQQIIRGVVERIYVCAYFIQVTFSDGTSFQVERIPFRTMRTMPKVLFDADIGKLPDPETPVLVTYVYRSYYSEQEGKFLGQDLTVPETVLYESGNLTIRAVGENPHIPRRRGVPRYVYDPSLPRE